jgi:uncharacterized protein
MTILRTLVAIASAALIHSHAQALPASQTSVETLLDITKSESMVESMYSNVEQAMRSGMKDALQGKPMSAQQQRIMDTVPTKFAAVMREALNWQQMKPMLVQLYRETFEEEEIQGLITFYKSPAGQAFVTKMPVVMQKSMAIGQSQMQALIPKMKEAMERAIAEVKAAK